MAEREQRTATVSFAASPDERELVRKVIERAEHEELFGGYGRESLKMDLIAAHANGCPIDFNKLLDAGRFDFTHDIAGIVRHLDRSSGELTMHFRPRCALPQPEGKADDDTLWMMHVQEPDDIWAAPSRERALAVAAKVNAFMADRVPKDDDNYPEVGAVVVPWDGTPEQHAQAVKKWAGEWEAVPAVSDASLTVTNPLLN